MKIIIILICIFYTSSIFCSDVINMTDEEYREYSKQKKEERQKAKEAKAKKEKKFLEHERERLHKLLSEYVMIAKEVEKMMQEKYMSEFVVSFYDAYTFKKMDDDVFYIAGVYKLSNSDMLHNGEWMFVRKKDGTFYCYKYVNCGLLFLSEYRKTYVSVNKTIFRSVNKVFNLKK